MCWTWKEKKPTESLSTACLTPVFSTWADITLNLNKLHVFVTFLPLKEHKIVVTWESFLVVNKSQQVLFNQKEFSKGSNSVTSRKTCYLCYLWKSFDILHVRYNDTFYYCSYFLRHSFIFISSLVHSSKGVFTKLLLC